MRLNPVTSFAVRRMEGKFVVVAIMRGRPGGFPLSYEDGTPMAFDDLDSAQAAAAAMSGDNNEYDSGVSPYNDIYDV